MATKSNPEAHLISILGQQKQLYVQVIPVAQTVSERLGSGEFPQVEFESMNELLNQIRELDQQVIAERTLVDADRLSPGSPLPGLKRELEDMVTKLLEITNGLESKLKSAKEQLAPHMSQQVVASKMNRAYTR